MKSRTLKYCNRVAKRCQTVTKMLLFSKSRHTFVINYIYVYYRNFNISAKYISLKVYKKSAAVKILLSPTPPAKISTRPLTKTRKCGGWPRLLTHTFKQVVTRLLKQQLDCVIELIIISSSTVLGNKQIQIDYINRDKQRQTQVNRVKYDKLLLA